MKNQFIGLHLDFVGFSASLLCSLHCATLPSLLSLTSLASLQFLNTFWIEYSIILVSFSIASYALVHGYRKHHQKPTALVIVLSGFILIISGHLFQAEWHETVLTPCGAAVVAIAHFVNWIQIKQSSVEFPDCQ
ncbi:MerC domain-containing protein [Reichenbachiella carrageenanivorans]|uniref:MerC domain-containing protein n=1 Tax=Reichenbachiella carrageenanivorans TaxID=2979869 RepID=A0ABY6CY16_9BACT|nr:MerC domain-containing protein [Reichenbachiella carrageenanivorans]UXX78809.1 MerC domain-containing protein [Reichenbachiella carrageenanivorans]